MQSNALTFIATFIISLKLYGLFNIKLNMLSASYILYLRVLNIKKLIQLIKLDLFVYILLIINFTTTQQNVPEKM